MNIGNEQVNIPITVSLVVHISNIAVRDIVLAEFRDEDDLKVMNRGLVQATRAWLEADEPKPER